jgi:YVTN family beta-propeller protein
MISRRHVTLRVILSIAIAFCATLLLPSHAAYAQAGLVSHWTAEGNANDVVGGNNGILQGGASFSQGFAGQAFSLNGIGYIDVPDSPSLSITGPLTLTAWINVNANDFQQAIIEKYDVPGLRGYLLRIVGGKLQGAICDASLYGAQHPASGATTITTGVWHHVAAVYDGATIKVYLDGILDGSAPTITAPVDGSASLKIGARGDDADTRLNGLIDEVRIYDQALSSTEIQALATTTPVATPIQSRAYVTSAGTNTLKIVDLATNAVIESIPLNNYPFEIAVSPDGTRAYVTNIGSNNVSVINTASSRVIATVPTGNGPVGIALNPDASRAYVANNLSNSVTIIDTSTFAVLATVPVDVTPDGISITPDGTRAYVANENANTVSVISTATNTVTATIHFPVSPDGLTIQPYDIEITPDGMLAVVADAVSAVSIINTSTNAIVRTIDVGGTPRYVSIAKDGHFAYVSNEDGGYISVINLTTLTLTATIPVEGHPYGIAVSENGGNIYVANTTSDFSVIDIGTQAVITSIRIPPARETVTLWEAPPSPPPGSQTLTLSGLADIYNAGRLSSNSDGTLPPVYVFPAGANQSLVFSNVTGSGYASGPTTTQTSADGANNFGIGYTGINSANGLSGIRYEGKTPLFMVGVFKDDNGTTPTPADLTYSAGVNDNLLSYSPLMNQVFFIGDGLSGTGSGVAQRFTVPAGATHLYLGFLDANNYNGNPGAYFDNGGSFSATFTISGSTDSTPPVITPTVTGSLGNNDWYTGDVDVSWSVTDPESSVSTSTGCETVNITADTSGLTVTCSATSSGGTDTKSVTIKRDASAPSFSCGSADGNWHSADVSIPCSAIDTSSGLSLSGDAGFSLSTSVIAGNETSNSMTGSRNVCDNAGNCATAGPISGNKVDKKAPTIVITTPTSAFYVLNQSVAASFTCQDGGSGVSTCDGSVPTGSNIDTSSVGSKTFTVSATDNVANSTIPQLVSYNVGYAVNVLYDQTKAVKSGSTIPIKIELVDALGHNMSSSAVIVHAVSLVQISTTASDTINDAGSSNPDVNFRFDSSLSVGGGYIFNLKTTGLPTGTYRLGFTVDSDLAIRTVQFAVRQ